MMAPIIFYSHSIIYLRMALRIISQETSNSLAICLTLFMVAQDMINWD